MNVGLNWRVEQMMLPNEEDKKIQDILALDISNAKKGYRIEGYYKSKIPYNRNRQKSQEQPAMYHLQIEMELDRRGENQTPIDV